jgi:hypothetical protein
MRLLAVMAAAALLGGCGGRTTDIGGVHPVPSGVGSGSGGGSDQGATVGSAGSTAAAGGGAGSGAGGSGTGAGGSRAISISCGTRGDPLDTSQLADLKQHILGQWEYCSGPLLFARQHAGIEFTADYQWYFLQVDASGELVRGSGFGGQGTWSFIDASLMNGPGDFAYQLNLDISGGGFNPTFLKFAANPTSMRVNWMLGFTDYVAVGQ